MTAAVPKPPAKEWGLAPGANPLPGQKGRFLHLGCSDVILPEELGWVNTDAFYDDPRVMRLDMTQVPWTQFKDGEFDHVYASHVFEHVLEEVTLVEMGGRLVKRDVIWSVFEEIHRVLRPGGILEIVVPLAGTWSAYNHIGHTRTNWTPMTGWQLDHRNPERYLRPGCDFEYLDWRIQRSWKPGRDDVRLPFFLLLGKSRLPLTRHLTLRLPWTHRLLTKPSEIRIRVRKLAPPA